jgi:hypothetical protein
VQLARRHNLGEGQRSRPRLRIDVATHRRRRRYGAETFEDPGSADITGVDDAIAPAQRIDGFGTEQTVRIGDDADDHR